MALKLNIRRLEDKDVALHGELSPKDLDLDCADELVHVRQPLHYDLKAHKAGRNVVVEGRFELVLDCECARCLKPFQQNLEVADWMAHLPLEGDEKVEIKDDSVDLTPFVREDILLEFPQHPLCKVECAGLANRTEKNAKQIKGASQTHGSSAWAELNKLKF
jgi:uncharacterized protein